MLRADVPNKLDPIHLRQWLDEYHTTRQRYILNRIGRDVAKTTLRRLGYRGSALDIELTDFARLRAQFSKRHVDFGPTGA